ncbi:hypothetical protein C8R47DRAFT_130154 [Mycena vitilis]|nr:hypothetical protein C8R47DRAFT_130154 [Mycena vitilis]
MSQRPQTTTEQLTLGARRHTRSDLVGVGHVSSGAVRSLNNHGAQIRLGERVSDVQETAARAYPMRSKEASRGEGDASTQLRTSLRVFLNSWTRGLRIKIALRWPQTRSYSPAITWADREPHSTDMGLQQTPAPFTDHGIDWVGVGYVGLWPMIHEPRLRLLSRHLILAPPVRSFVLPHGSGRNRASNHRYPRYNGARRRRLDHVARSSRKGAMR